MTTFKVGDRVIATNGATGEQLRGVITRGNYRFAGQNVVSIRWIGKPHHMAFNNRSEAFLVNGVALDPDLPERPSGHCLVCGIALWTDIEHECPPAFQNRTPDQETDNDEAATT